VKTICSMTSMNVSENTVWDVDAMSASCEPSYGTSLPHEQVHRRRDTEIRPRRVCNTAPEFLMPMPL